MPAVLILTKTSCGEYSCTGATGNGGTGTQCNTGCTDFMTDCAQYHLCESNTCVNDPGCPSGSRYYMKSSNVQQHGWCNNIDYPSDYYDTSLSFSTCSGAGGWGISCFSECGSGDIREFNTGSTMGAYSIMYCLNCDYDDHVMCE